MKQYTAAQFKSEFSDVVAELKQGREVIITYGRNKQILGKVIPGSKLEKPDYSIRLGDLEEQGWTYKMKDFEISDEELLGS